MDLNPLIAETADQADDLLAGCTAPSEANILLLDHLAATHPNLPAPVRQKIATQVIAILQNEDFFEGGPGGADWDDDDSDDDQSDE